MITIDKKRIRDYFLIDLYYEINTLTAHIEMFEKKYKKKFSDFEQYIKQQKEENVTNWDDYIEWKAYEKTKEGLLKQKSDIEHGKRHFHIINMKKETF